MGHLLFITGSGGSGFGKSDEPAKDIPRRQNKITNGLKNQEFCQKGIEVI